MPHAGNCCPALAKKSNTAVDPRSFLFAGVGGVAAPGGFIKQKLDCRRIAGLSADAHQFDPPH
ncbi:hypothetical protein RA20_10510 [Leisingera sp. ANG-Vp]|nr:hypothetical protein RA20_10510 [Leisingera sp. ANG-Vp]